VIGRLAAEDVCNGVANTLLVTVELDELTSGDFALLIICALVATDAAPNVQIRMRNANARVLL
jgi:hypothetical protein